MIDSPIITLVGLLIAAGIGGALVGALVSACIAARIVKHWLPPFPEFVAIKAVSLTSAVFGKDAAVQQRQEISISYDDVASHCVERWLDRRNLMMTPKGQDFSVPVSSKKADA